MGGSTVYSGVSQSITVKIFMAPHVFPIPRITLISLD